MSFTNFSQIVQPAPWVDPINLDLLRQGNMYKEEIARQNLSNLSESFQALASTPAYGKDAEKLQEKLQELKSQIGGLNLSDVSDYNTMGQIKGVINQFSSDKDMLGIGQRGTLYTSELKKKEAAEAKGETYISDILREGDKYYNQGLYDPNKRFNGSGMIAPQLEKDFLAQVDKMKASGELIYDEKTHQYTTKEGVPEDRLKLAYINMVKFDPRKQELYQHKIKDKYGDEMSKIFEQEKAKELQEIKSAYEIAKAKGDNASASQFEKNYSDLVSFTQNISEQGMIRYLADKEITKDAESHAKQHVWEKTEIPKLDDAYKYNQDYARDLEKQRQKEFYDNGIDPNTGLQLTDAQGRPISSGSSGKLSEKGKQNKIIVDKMVEEIKNKKTISLFTIKELADSGETIELEKKNGKATGYLLITKTTDPLNLQSLNPNSIPTPQPSRVSLIDFLKLRTGINPFEIAKGQSSDNTNSSTGTPAPKRSMK
jgi:hypothetical protein